LSEFGRWFDIGQNFTSNAFGWFANAPSGEKMRNYFAFAGRGPVLAATFAGTLLFLFIAFPSLPIEGELLDLKPGYSHGEAMAEMEAYGAAGRVIYAWASAVLDTLFPITYVTFFAGLIYRFRLTEGSWVLAYIPVFAGAWDLLENAQIIAMLLRYPEVGAGQVAWASMFTTVKGHLGTIYQILGAALLLAALVRAAVARLRG